MGTDNYLVIPALGRVADLGYMYDARTESFHESIFRGQIKPELIHTSQTPYTFTEIRYTNSLTDKFSLFDIKAELTASILFGLFTVTGSAAYLTEEKKSARQSEGALILKTHTLAQHLPVYYDALRDEYQKDLFNYTQATHVVTGIKWGANVAIGFAEKFQESRSKEDVSGSMAIAFDKMKAIFSVSGSASVDKKGHDISENSGFTMKIYGDIKLPTEFPQTFEEIKDLIKKIPESIENSNDGKGVRLEYTLVPLTHIRQFLKEDSPSQSLFTKIDDSFNQILINIFDDLSKMEQRLNDLLEDFTVHSICTLDEPRSQLYELKINFQNSKIKLKSEIKDALVKVKSRQCDITVLSKILEEFTTANDYNLKNVEKRLQGFKEAIEKITFYKMLNCTYPRIEYIGRDVSLQNKLYGTENHGKALYMLYTKSEFIRKDGGGGLEAWKAQLSLFLCTLYQPFNQLYVIDCDFNAAEYSTIDRVLIKQMINGIVVNEDVFAELQNPKTGPLIHMKALGRNANLGDLYDARSDRFLDQSSILLPGYPHGLVDTVKSDDSEAHIVPMETFSERCKAFGMDYEQQFSVMADLIPLTRSGAYLKEGQNPQSGARSVIHLQTLDKESINLRNPEFAKYLTMQHLMDSGATHFVQQVQFGFNSVFMFETKSGQADPLELPESQARKFNQILDHSSNLSQPRSEGQTGQIIKQEDLEGLGHSVQVKVFSDIQAADAQPETIQGTEDLLHYLNRKYFPQQAKQIQENKGQAIAYALYPLDNLRTSFGVLRRDFPFQDVMSTGVNPVQFLELYDKITMARSRIDSINSELQRKPFCASEKERSDFNEIKSGFNANFGKFTAEFKKAVLGVRSSTGSTGFEEMERFRLKYEKLGGFGMDGHYSALSKMENLESKLQIENVRSKPSELLQLYENLKVRIQALEERS